MMPGIVAGGAVSGGSGGSGYADLVLAASPRMYWRLGEASGTVAADASGNGFAGTYRRDASLTASAGLLTGDTDGAYLGPGAPTSPISGISRSTPVDPGSDWTFTMLLRPDGVPAGDGGVGIVLMLGGNLNVPELGVLDAGSGRFRLRFNRAGAANVFNSASTYAYGTRLHVKLSRSGSAIDLRVNGVAEGSSAYAFSSESGPLRLGYGNYSSSGDGYQHYGVIDELAGWQSFVPDSITDAQYAAAWGG